MVEPTCPRVPEPTGHLRHSSGPMTALKKSSGQAAQVELLLVRVPDHPSKHRHSSTDWAPSRIVLECTGQSTHKRGPTADLYLPREHGVQMASAVVRLPSSQTALVTGRIMETMISLPLTSAVPCVASPAVMSSVLLLAGRPTVRTLPLRSLLLSFGANVIHIAGIMVAGNAGQ